jgi:hypothetical protein
VEYGDVLLVPSAPTTVAPPPSPSLGHVPPLLLAPPVQSSMTHTQSQGHKVEMPSFTSARMIFMGAILAAMPLEKRPTTPWT